MILNTGISPLLNTKAAGIFFIFITFSLMLGCASDYTQRTRSALSNFESRRYDEALTSYEKQAGKTKDKLIYLIDRGIILHTKGDYEQSIKVLQEAEDYAESIDYFSVTNEVASLFVNERMSKYKGEAFERVLINVYKAIDYTMLGQIEEALVECRKIDLKLEKFNKLLKTNQRDPFPRYMSGILFESSGDINDAYIDYKKAYQISPNFHYLASDLISLSKKLAFMDDYAQWQKIFGVESKKRKDYRGFGELIFIFECGKSPVKVSSERDDGVQLIPVPMYIDRPSVVSRALIFEDGRKIARTYLLSDIGELSKKYLEKRIGAYIARGVARLAIKTGAAVAIGKATKSKELGILAGILLMHTNKADLRSVLTLPKNIQIARVFLKAGTHDLEIKFRSRGGFSKESKFFKGVKIESGKRTFLNYRSFE